MTTITLDTIACPDCDARLIGPPSAQLIHNEDGSHTYVPPSDPEPSEDDPTIADEPPTEENA